MVEIQIRRKLIFLIHPLCSSDEIYIYIYIARDFLAEYTSERQRKEQRVSRWAVLLNLWIFDLVPDCPENRKQTIIQHCEKAKKLNAISTCEVVPRIKRGKHNRHLRLPCARLLTVRIKKDLYEKLTNCVLNIVTFCKLFLGIDFFSFLIVWSHSFIRRFSVSANDWSGDWI